VTDQNTHGDVVDWTGGEPPRRVTLEGRTVRVEPLDSGRHASDLWELAAGPRADPAQWDYLAIGPYESEKPFRTELETRAASTDPLFFAVVDPVSGAAQGIASLLRIDPANGVAEIGHIWFGAPLQRSTAATEAIYLLTDYVMTTLGYRRFEWKCNDLNQRSRRAAKRFGFTYEGTFRNHMVVKGRNRDTAWYAIIDRDWPTVKAGFEAWLNLGNFDASGNQIRTLEQCRAAMS
jgi:RimJ/RimL family protein N-acetyltransferase